jgi:hypothetical protein
MNAFKNARVLPLSRISVYAIWYPRLRPDRDQPRAAWCPRFFRQLLRAGVVLEAFGTRRAEYESPELAAKGFSMEIVRHGIFVITAHAADPIPAFVAGDPS